MKPSLAFTLSSFALVAASSPLSAAISVFVNDQSGFTLAASSKVLNGTENWSSAGSAVDQVLNDSLNPGVANGPFPNGTNVNTGLIVQSNTGGANSVVTAPRGTSGLFYAPTGFAGYSGNHQPSNQLSTGFATDSFDMIMSLPNVQAVSMSPTFYQGNGTLPSSGTITFKIYDKSNNLLQSGTIPNVVDVSESSFLGIVATNGESIGRINLFSNSSNFVGADNISVYSVPEASTLVLALAGAAGLMRRRRH